MSPVVTESTQATRWVSALIRGLFIQIQNEVLFYNSSGSKISGIIPAGSVSDDFGDDGRHKPLVDNVRLFHYNHINNCWIPKRQGRGRLAGYAQQG